MKGKKIIAALAAVVFLLGNAPAVSAREYNDYEKITSHVGLSVSRKLQIARPADLEINTGEAYYYITGGSDPEKTLTMNGEPVTGRGSFGSFAVYVALQNGENVFTFENGSDSETVRITRGGSVTVPTTSVLTSQIPQFDIALNAGEPLSLSCIAPAGASVTAAVNGKNFTLNQVAAASEGVPAVFRAEISMPEASGVEDLGKVTYTLNYRGKSTDYSSAGKLFSVGKGATLCVQMKDTASTLFAEESTSSGFVTTAKKGGIDYVAEIGEKMYRLGMGGWVLMEAVTPLTGNPGYRNSVSDVRFRQDSNGESYLFKGTGKPLFSAYQNAEELHITFHHTSGVGNVPVKESTLFSGVTVTEENGDTVLSFKLSGNRTLWGYVVEYDENGDTVLTCRYKPQLSSGNQPLKGVTVVLDPGHGGTDSGALGVAYLNGPSEKEINFDTALAVEKRLRGLGANVVLTRAGDDTVSLSDRQWVSQEQQADFFIALHCNSIAANTNGLKPNGVEVYYYENISAPFATALMNEMTAATGRAARRAAYSNFKVTLNSYAPSVLLEMGFLSNPKEYDSLCSKRGIFHTANAIADSIINYLS